MSGGELLIDNYRRTIRIDGEFKDYKEIENLIVKNQNLNIVYLRDIAKVTFEEKEAESFAREFKKPVVMLDVAVETLREQGLLVRAGGGEYNPYRKVAEIAQDRSAWKKGGSAGGMILLVLVR